MVIPISISLALAERVNQFKKKSLDKQIQLNEKLESKIEERTLDLKKSTD